MKWIQVQLQFDVTIIVCWVRFVAATDCKSRVGAVHVQAAVAVHVGPRGWSALCCWMLMLLYLQASELFMLLLSGSVDVEQKIVGLVLMILVLELVCGTFIRLTLWVHELVSM